MIGSTPIRVLTERQWQPSACEKCCHRRPTYLCHISVSVCLSLYLNVSMSISASGSAYVSFSVRGCVYLCLSMFSCVCVYLCLSLYVRMPASISLTATLPLRFYDRCIALCVSVSVSVHISVSMCLCLCLSLCPGSPRWASGFIWEPLSAI